MASFLVNFHVMPWDYYRMTVEEREAVVRLTHKQAKRR